jgi:putative hydrolase of the HAD superfamily
MAGPYSQARLLFMIRAVLFDVGGVLTLPLRDALLPAAVASGADLSRVGGQLFSAFSSPGDGDEPVHRLERGEIALTEFLAGFGDDADQVGLLLDPASPHFGFGFLRRHEGMHALVDEVRGSGYLVGVLSNTVREWQPAWDAVMPGRDTVDAAVMSWEVGLRKPNRAIYEHAAAALGLPAADILMVDDFPAMVDGARSAGMTAVHVDDHDRAIAEVRSLLDLPGS